MTKISAEDYYWDHSPREVLETAGLDEGATANDIEDAVEREISFASMGCSDLDAEDLQGFLTRMVEAAKVKGNNQ